MLFILDFMALLRKSYERLELMFTVIQMLANLFRLSIYKLVRMKDRPKFRKKLTWAMGINIVLRIRKKCYFINKFVTSGIIDRNIFRKCVVV